MRRITSILATLLLVMLPSMGVHAADVVAESPWVGSAVENGQTYYLYNPAAKAFLTGANDWGTQASLGQDGLPFIAEGADGVYALNGVVSNGGTQTYLGNAGYIDANAAQFTLTEVQTGVYTIGWDGSYYASTEGNAVVQIVEEVSEACYWQFLTVADIHAGMANASGKNPLNVTSLVACANFSRNNTQITAWQGSPARGGDNTNMCAEMWNTDYHVYQTISVPNGVYKITAQGFYRMGGADEAATHWSTSSYKNHAQFYANEVAVDFPTIFDELDNYNGDGITTSFGVIPNSMSQASAAFTAGLYQMKSIQVMVLDGQLTIGFKKENIVANDWSIFDNIQIVYCGAEITADVVGSVNPAEYPETQLFAIMNVAGNNYLTADARITIEARDVKNGNQCFYFIPTETAGQYHLKSYSGNYVKSAHNNNWTMTATETTSANTLHEIVAIEEGVYTIGMVGKGKVIGTDNLENGSPTYSDKTAANNGKWYIIPVTFDITSALQNAVDEAKAITGAMNVAVATELAAAIAAAEEAIALEQPAAIDEAKNRLRVATQAALTSVDEYTTLASSISYYESFYVATANGATDYHTALTEAQDALNSGSADATTLPALTEALNTYLLNNEIDAIVNGTFDAPNQKDGWIDGIGSMNTGNHNKWTNVNGGFVEKWQNTLPDLDFYQDIEGLPAGTYTFAVYVVACQQSQDDSYEVSGVKVYANDAAVEVHTINVDRNETNRAIGPELVMVTTTIETGETLRVGMSVTSTDANWVVMDNAKLYCFTPSEDMLNAAKEELSALLTAAGNIAPTYSAGAKAQLDEAITAGNAAQNATTRDQIVKAIAELKEAIARAERSVLINAIELTSTSIVDFTQFVVNPDMSNGTINGWTTTPGWQYQASTHTGTGSTISQFQEQWTWGTGLGDLSSMQTLMDLPNGTYIITVDAVATVQYMDGDYKENTTGAYWVANDQSIAIATYGQPEKFYILTEVTDGILQMGMVGINTTANWMAFDNVKVTYYGEDIDAELVKEGWRFTDGHLVVYRDFPYTSSEEYPWHSLRQQITSIEFVGGVTRVGNWAFFDCDNLTTLTIPEGITAIGYEAFYSCDNLNTLSLPESLITIEGYAFEWCTSLTSITLPSRLETIDYCAFIGCQGLTSITIPTSVTSIGHNAFGHCYNLTSIVVEEGNTVYDSRNGCNAIIETAINKLIQGCNATVIPEGIVTIGENALYNCYNLNAITLPSSLTTIENNAFNSCGSLTEITLPSSLTTIGDNAFSYCGSLTAITIPSSVTYIGESPFASCNSLNTIVVEEGNTVYDSRNGCNAIIETATNKLIQGCNTTVIPENIVTIGNSAFNGCTFSTITIPEGVTTIEGNAFWCCTNLTEIILPESLTTIGYHAFYYCLNLTSITIPASVTTIDGYAFNYCQSLATITSLATTAPTLGDGAFSNISTEAELYYPEGSDYSSWMKYFPPAYYMKNVATGTYLQGGSNGIQAALGTQGLDVKIMHQWDNRYTIRTGIGSGYLSHEAQVNSWDSQWIMEQHANGYYTFENSNNNGYYLGYNGEMVSGYMTNPSDANAQWQLVTKEERMAELADAVQGNPMSATFLIRGAAFNNGDSRNQSWVGDYLHGGYDNGNESNYCAEQWDVATIDIHQELAGIPNGYYRLAAQGFYRMNDGSNNTSDVAAEHHAAGTETLNALLYANEKGTPLMSIMEGVQDTWFDQGSSWQTTYGYVPHDMASAAWAFTAGLYQNSLWVYVNDGTLRVGVKKNEGGGYDWTIFDNFNLDYYGTELTADASDELSFKLVYAEQLIKNNPTVIGAVLPALQAEIDAANNIENLDKAIDAFEAAIPVYNELHVLVEQYTDNKRIATEVNAGKAILAEKNAATQSVQDTLDALKLAISTLYEMEVGEIFTYTNSQGVEKRYRVLGTNMIANASFHNGTDGWTGGAGGALTNTGWHAEGGMDGGAYICPTSNTGKGSDNSIGAAWEIVKGNTYVFSYYISHTSAEASAKEGYIVTSETNTPRGEETKTIMYAHADAEHAWTKNMVVTTAEYNYLQFCARWLGGRFNFDAFYLAEVEEIPDPKELLDLVAECDEWLAHYDNPEGVEPLETKMDEAEALVESDAYNAKMLNAMIASLSDALLEFRITNASLEDPVVVNAKYGKNLDFESAFASWTTENESVSNGINIRQLPYFGETTRVCEINGKPIAATSISQVIKGLPTGYYKVSVDVVMNHGFNGQAGAMMSFNGTELDITTDEITLNDATAEESHPQTFVIESFVTADSVKLTLSAQAEATFTYLAIDNIEIEYYGKYIELGDVNNDFRHTMNDVVMTVNAVLEKPSVKFNPYAADMNMNDDINMGDVVNILHMVLNDGMDADYARSRMTYDNALALTAHETLVSTDATSTIPVALSNENNYAAFQIDVELPEGVTFVDATLSNRATSTHTLSWNTLSNGKVRIIAYSADNAAFKGNEGDLINLVVKASDMMVENSAMTITKGIFVTTSGAEQTVEDIEVTLRTHATDMEAIYSGAAKVSGTNGAIIVVTDEAAVVDIYTVTGQLVHSATTVAGKNIITVPAGIYVVNNSKVIVK